LQVFAKGKGRRMQAPMMPAGQMVSALLRTSTTLLRLQQLMQLNHHLFKLW
jgi:hypothetical protein